MDFFAVKVAVEVEKIHFDEHVAFGTVADSGPVSNVGHRLVSQTVVIDQTGIYAALVEKHVFFGQFKVSRWEADGAPDFVAAYHRSGHRIGIA